MQNGNLQEGQQIAKLQEPISKQNLQSDTQPKLKKIKTRTTIIEQREDEDLKYEQIIVIVFIILGIFLFVYSAKVKSHEIEYTNYDSDICNKNFILDKDIDKPVFAYYQLDGFCQKIKKIFEI
jgi:hypothetical protein